MKMMIMIVVFVFICDDFILFLFLPDRMINTGKIIII